MSDISQISEYTKIAQNVVVSLSAATTVILAALGYDKWKKEIRGTSEYKKAKEILKVVYKTKRAFSRVRHPAIYQYEYPEELTDRTGHLKNEHRYEGTAHVYQERWKTMDEAFGELEDLILDAIVEFGREFEEAIIPLRKCRVELNLAIQDHLQRIKNPYDAPPQMTDLEGKTDRSILYESGPDSKHDKFTPKILEAIEALESKLQKYIK